LNTRLKEYWGECFYMGGLGGIPFVGEVGIGAYCSHVPTNGSLLILYAPHVGISPEGVIGNYSRPGQIHEDKACGAAIGALKKLNETNGGGGDTLNLKDANNHNY
jgi:hypothetical protein